MTQTPKSDDAPSYHRSKTPIETSARALQILHACDQLLAERGPDHVSMRDVAERAGVNKALIFYYFGSRTELFEKVLERYYKNHAKALAAAFGGGGTPLERVRRAIDAYLDFMDHNHLFSRLVMQEIARHDDGKLPQIRANLQQLYQLMRDEFADLLPTDGPLAARHFFVTLSATVINYYTYARVLGTEVWGRDPNDDVALGERRAHIQWMAETVMKRVLSERAAL